MSSASIRSFHDTTTGSVTHVVADPVSRRAAIIDPLLDFDAGTAHASSLNAHLVLDWVRENGFAVDWLLETHVHADHLSAAAWMQHRVGGRIATGRGVCAVQQTVRTLFNDPSIAVDGRPFDQLFDDDERFAIGQLPVRVLDTPGHSPGSVTYVVGDDAFVGDTLFMPDAGSARCDLPGGDAATLYRSVRRLYDELPPHARLHLCHDDPNDRRGPAWVASVQDQREHNVHLNDGIDEARFVELRRARDRTLPKPRLLLPALQVNVRVGRFPEPEPNGRRYLKLPVGAL